MASGNWTDGIKLKQWHFLLQMLCLDRLVYYGSHAALFMLLDLPLVLVDNRQDS